MTDIFCICYYARIQISPWLFLSKNSITYAQPYTRILNITYICSNVIVQITLLYSSEQESKHLFHLLSKISDTTCVLLCIKKKYHLCLLLCKNSNNTSLSLSLSLLCENAYNTNVCSYEQFITAETNFLQLHLLEVIRYLRPYLFPHFTSHKPIMRSVSPHQHLQHFPLTNYVIRKKSTPEMQGIIFMDFAVTYQVHRSHNIIGIKY
jgi:hypothetical protein